MSLKTFAFSSLALSLSLAFTPAHAQSAEAQLVKKLDALAAELAQLKAELQQVKTQQNSAAAMAPAASAVASGEPTTQISSYGEIVYSRPTRDTSGTTADVGRFVIGLQHRFDERTKVVSELEVEHAVASSTDSGEVEVEQLYIEHALNQNYGLRAGLFLMPLGLTNMNHEPTAYYGNFRPTVETAIIPSTLREIGLQMYGEHNNGVSWSAGISTGPDLTKWDPLSSEGVESPLRSVHQEGQSAKSKDLSLFGAVDWRGIPGLRLGSGLVTGKMGHGTAGFAAPNARYTLWDLHAKWTPGAWDLSALYAYGGISGAGDLNATFGAGTALVPKRFDGLYGQAAYKFNLGGSYAVSPFARYERVNTGRSFDGVVADAYKTEGILTVGANFNISPSVVFKADVQRFKVNKDSNRLNLGVGFSF